MARSSGGKYEGLPTYSERAVEACGATAPDIPPNPPPGAKDRYFYQPDCQERVV
eukprot:m.189299 g.189299  ORF g.189299 m.189299 type:complete len:54 (+) comp24853_c0_seq2:935-1096(+)